MSTERFEHIERLSQALERVASGYAPTSDEHEAISLAALALAFAASEHANEFRSFVLQSGDELTVEQRSRLAQIGLE